MIGDMLEHWTNGVLQATEHRVMNSEKKRQSIVRFNGADGKTEIEPLSQFVSASCPSKYPRISQRKHIEEHIRIASNHLEAAKATKF
jgi:isopenicillin N synthase-like dioxygenase